MKRRQKIRTLFPSLQPKLFSGLGLLTVPAKAGPVEQGINQKTLDEPKIKYET